MTRFNTNKEYEPPTAQQQKRYDEKIKPFLFQMALIMRNGGKLDDCSDLLGMTTQSLRNYRKCFKEIDEAILTGVDTAVETAENSLAMLAAGYTYKEIEEKFRPADDVDENEDDPEKKMILISRTEKTKVKPPDINAIKFYLLNKAPHAWQNKAIIDATQNNFSFDGIDVDDEMVKKAIAEIQGDVISKNKEYGDAVDVDADSDEDSDDSNDDDEDS